MQHMGVFHKKLSIKNLLKTRKVTQWPLTHTHTHEYWGSRVRELIEQ